MQSLIAGFGGDELHSINAVRNGHAEGNLHPEKGFGKWTFHSVSQVMQLLINQCDLATYPHEQHVAFVLAVISRDFASAEAIRTAAALALFAAKPRPRVIKPRKTVAITAVKATTTAQASHQTTHPC
ncbi:hypothetical protein [Stenotrophomonas geniculata]